VTATPEVPDSVAVWLVGDAPMTGERAHRIRAWRVAQGFTWRAIAVAACSAWGGGHAGNPRRGHALCWMAATTLGEDPDDRPWN
jgi:hypothetical protein